MGTPDLTSGDGGVLCDGGLLVETMNNVDPVVVVVVVVFCNRNGKFFFLTVNNEYFFLDQTGSGV